MIGAKLKIDARAGWKFILLSQLAVAGLLILSDIADAIVLPGQDREMLKTGPVSPGDQRRIYRTDKPIPNLLTPNETLDLEMPLKFSNRLEFSEHMLEKLGNVVLVSGDIAAGDARRFREFISRLENTPDFVALHSPGGLVWEALEIGRYLRQEEIRTAVMPGALCASACPYILAGGTERHVSLRGLVGMHQHYYEQPKYLPVFFAVEDIQSGQGETMEYLIEMDIDPSVMIYSLKTPPEEIYALVESELVETRMATMVTD
jgi:hypothetical protein